MAVALVLLLLLQPSAAYLPSASLRSSLRSIAHRSSRVAAVAAADKFNVNGYDIRGPLAPIGDYMLVKQADSTSVTAGGIVLGAASQEKPVQGEVVAVGQAWTDPSTGKQRDLPVSEGDALVYNRYGGVRVKYNDVEHLLVKLEDVLMVFPGGDVELANAVPVQDHVVVKQAEVETSTSSGILIASVSEDKEKPAYGEVVAVGGGKWLANMETGPMTVTVGDNVMFEQYSGIEVKIGEQELLVLRQPSVMAKW